MPDGKVIPTKTQFTTGGEQKATVLFNRLHIHSPVYKVTDSATGVPTEPSICKLAGNHRDSCAMRFWLGRSRNQRRYDRGAPGGLTFGWLRPPAELP